MPGWAAAVLLFVALTKAVQAADLAYRRAVDTALASPVLPADIVERTRNACDQALCFAATLAEALPDKVYLEPVTHPDTDSIRWARTTPSVIVDHANGARTLRITHFGRKALAELRAASAPGGSPVTIDLRGNAGGDFERMLEIAGLLIGSRRDLVEIDHGERIERRSLKGQRQRPWRVARVLIDEKTASAARLLAHLLAASGAAELIGPDHGGPIFLKRRLTIDHDWRLLLPVATVRVIAPD